MSPRLPRRSPEEPVDLSVSRRCHVVGVAGPGMSPLAFVLRGLGHRVSGSDIRESPVLEMLRRTGVSVTVGHDATLVDDAGSTWVTGLASFATSGNSEGWPPKKSCSAGTRTLSPYSVDCLRIVCKSEAP